MGWLKDYMYANKKSWKVVVLKEEPYDPSLPAYDHKARHVFLHDCLDELVLDYISQNNKPMSEITVMELMEWSYQQTLNPTV